MGQMPKPKLPRNPIQRQQQRFRAIWIRHELNESAPWQYFGLSSAVGLIPPSSAMDKAAAATVRRRPFQVYLLVEEILPRGKPLPLSPGEEAKKNEKKKNNEENKYGFQTAAQFAGSNRSGVGTSAVRRRAERAILVSQRKACCASFCLRSSSSSARALQMSQTFC